METWIQRSFAPAKRLLPPFIWKPIRSAATAFVTPWRSFYRAGHFRSSFAEKAVDKRGNPLPWYTYPCIAFLQQHSFAGRRVLEFGAGQSTLWWAAQAEFVLSLEDNPEWGRYVSSKVSKNASVVLVGDVGQALSDAGKFDIVVIDGLNRTAMVPFAIAHLADGGAIICDNSNSFDFQGSFEGSGFQRVDFIGNAPGVILAHATSIFFRDKCFLFEPKRAPVVGA